EKGQARRWRAPPTGEIAMLPRALVLAVGLLSVALACTALPASGPSGKPAGARPESASAAPPAVGAPAAAPAAPTKGIIAHFPGTHSSGLYIAHERGYFAELGIEADLTPMNSMPDAAVLMSTGQLDVYGGGTGAALYNAVSRGIRLHAVADKAHS